MNLPPSRKYTSMFSEYSEGMIESDGLSGRRWEEIMLSSLEPVKSISSKPSRRLLQRAERLSKVWVKSKLE